MENTVPQRMEKLGGAESLGPFARPRMSENYTSNPFKQAVPTIELCTHSYSLLPDKNLEMP